MLEQPGNVSNVGYNAHVIKTTYGTSKSAKATASRNVAGDDGATSIIQNPLQTEPTGIQQDAFNKDKVTFSSIVKENLLKLRELATKLEGRLRNIGEGVDSFESNGVLERLKKEIEAFNDGGVLERLRKEIEAFKGGGVLERLKEEIEALNDGGVLERLRKEIKAFKGGDVLERLKKEIEAIIAFEGVLLVVNKEIDEYAKFMEFRLEQMLEVKQHMVERHMTEMDEALNKILELGIYTVARMRDETVKALQGQANTDPDRALHFLKDRD